MSTTTYVPIEVYLRSSYEPDAEYVDGEIEERPMGQFDHSSWQQAILRWFWPHEMEWNVRVRPELRVRVSPTRFRVPDVTVLDRDEAPEQIITRPPLAVFEVLSPEDTLQRLKRKLDDYAAMGISQIWIIDPQDGSFSRYEEKQLLRGNKFVLASKGIAFEIARIGELLD